LDSALTGRRQPTARVPEPRITESEYSDFRLEELSWSSATVTR
jgi:hypothetical protein